MGILRQAQDKWRLWHVPIAWDIPSIIIKAILKLTIVNPTYRGLEWLC
jgi:hypothetical protein